MVRFLEPIFAFLFAILLGPVIAFWLVQEAGDHKAQWRDFSEEDNCLTFTFRMLAYGQRDSLLITKSFYSWFPHFAIMIELISGDLEKWEYVPIAPEDRSFPPLFFRGKFQRTRYRQIPIEDDHNIEE